jgi:hypothetical protein
VAKKFHSAELKLGNASKHVRDINELLEKSPPFSYVLETDTQSRQRSTFARKNEAVIDAIGLLCGDAAHNLRSALDHAYNEIVLPFAKTDGERKAVQFPFCDGPNRLAEAVKNRLAHRVSTSFFDKICSFKPHGEPSGAKLLYLVDKMNIPDKHRTLTPIGDYKRISGNILQRQVPDFPFRAFTGSFGNCYRDVVWHYQGSIDIETLGSLRPPFTCVFEKKLDVPVDVIFEIAEANYRGPLVSTFHQMINVIRTVIDEMRPFAV